MSCQYFHCCILSECNWLSFIPLGQPCVTIKNLLEALLQSKSSFLWNVSDVVGPHQTTHTKSKVKVAVLISGTGELLALLHMTKTISAMGNFDFAMMQV